MKHTRPSIAHSSLPNGQALYQACLDFHLSLSMTPQEVFDLGQAEVERITQAMRKIAREEGYGDDIAKFKEALGKREEFFFKTPVRFISVFSFDI